MKKIISLLVIVLVTNCFAQEIKFGKISKEELQKKFHPLDSTANAAYLYKHRRTFYRYDQNSGFTLITEVHNRIKIYNKEGFEKATFKIGLYKNGSAKEKTSRIKGYTFNDVQGKIEKVKLKSKHQFKEKISDDLNIVKVVFPSIKKGSIIDFKYTVSSPFTRSIDEVNFQYDIPVNLLNISIETPEYFNFKKASKGYYNVPVNTKTINQRVNISSKSRDEFTGEASFNRSSFEYKRFIDHYNAKNIPALSNNEQYVSNLNNYRGGIKYELSYIKFPDTPSKFYSTTWEDVSKKIYQFRNFGKELNKKKYYQKELINLIANTKNDIEKVTKIFHFIKTKIKWNGNYGKYTQKGVKKAYKTGTGNIAEINLMLTSMLREAGLNANPVLVSTRDYGIPLFPTLDGFNYVISIVELEKGSLLLDASEPYSIPNILPIRALNWSGRKVMKNGLSSWVNLSPTKHSLESNTLKVKIADDATLTGFLRQKQTLINALLSRKRYNHIKEEDIIAKLEEEYTIEIDNYKLMNKNDLGKSLNHMLKFSSEDHVEEINGKLYVNPSLFLASTKNPFKSDSRTFPVDFARPWKDNNTISIQIPEGYQVTSIPEQLAIGMPDQLGFFKFKVTNTGNLIQVNSITQINSSIIAPQYYEALKDFYAKVVAKQAEKIVLSKL